MSANKNIAKTLSKKKDIEIRHSYNIPPEIIELLRRNKRRSPPLHFLGYSESGIIKSWVPGPDTSNDPRWPELYLFGKSSNTSSASTSHAKTRIRRGPMVDGRVSVHCTGGPWWVGYECTTPDPFDQKSGLIEFNNIVEFQSKYYAVSTQGALAVFRNIDSRLVITDVGRSRGVPSVNSRFFKECVFELDGEIVVIFFVHEKSLESVDKVEVYSVDLGKLDWIRVERIQGKTLFLGQRWYWVNSGEVGCKENCVFFRQGYDNGWWVYDMETCCISPASMGN